MSLAVEFGYMIKPSTRHDISGIYAIKTPSGKMYIGSAVNFRRRHNGHRTTLMRQKHHCPGLQAAYNKYGFEGLKFEVLALVPKADLIEFEQAYLDRFWPKLYNCSPTASSPSGVVVSEVTRQKIRKALTGLKRSPETRARMSAAQSGRKMSEAARKKISAVQLGRKQSKETVEKRMSKVRGGIHKDNTTGFVGVGRFRDKFRARWGNAHLGLFATPEEAYAAVCKARDGNA